MSEKLMCKKCHLYVCASWVLAAYDTLSVLYSGNVSDTSNFLCTGNVHEMSPLYSNIFIYARKCLQEMWRKCAWNVLCPGSGNVPEIWPYTVSGNVKEMPKFPGVGIPYCEQEMWTILHISRDSWLRKFRISSSVLHFCLHCLSFTQASSPQ